MSRFGDLLSGESVTPPVVDTAPSSVEPVVEEAPRPEEEVAEIYEVMCHFKICQKMNLKTMDVL